MKKKYFIFTLFLSLGLCFSSMALMGQTSSVVVLDSETTAETDAANPDAVDADQNDVQVFKTGDGSQDREAYVKFDISGVEAENLSYATLTLMGGQHNDEADLINPYHVEMYTCADTSWSRDDLTWNTATSFTIGESPLTMANVLDFGTYRFYSPDLTQYIIDQKEDGADYVAFNFKSKDVHPFDVWLTGAWKGMKLKLSYAAPSEVIPSATTAEVDEANPDQIDKDVDPNDIQVWKKDGENRESYVKFDISAVSANFLKYAVISCVGGQHNGDEDMADPYWVQIHTCEDTAWSRDDLTWNIAKDFTIGEEALASVNVQGFNTYEFYSSAIAAYIKEQKDAGAESVAFKLVAKDAQPFDTWIGGAWKGLQLKLYEGDVNAEAIRDLQTGEANAGDPGSIDSNPADLMVQKNDDSNLQYESFVTFDVKDVEDANLTFAEISFKAGQHNGDADSLNKYMVDLLPMQDYSWTAADITWDTTRYFTSMYTPIASANVWTFNEYTFSGEALAGYINSQIEAGLDTIAFKLAAREAAPWDVWIGGDWEGLHLSFAQAVTGEEIAAPVFSDEGGTFETSPSIELTTESDGATIYYTLDGSTPNSESTEYTGAITLPDGTTEVKAIAIKDGSKSLIVAETFVIGSQEPFSGTPISLPGTVQAEDFDKGAMGIAYVEHEEENRMDGNEEKSDYRPDAPTVEVATADDQIWLAYQTNEWYEYTINNTIESAYEVKINYAMAAGFEREVSVELYPKDGGEKIVLFENVLFEGTGVDDQDWGTFVEKSLGKTQLIAIGEYELRYIFKQGYNFDWISFQPAVSVNNLDAVSGLKAYPNPVNSRLNLSFNSDRQYVSNIELMDITGKTVLQLTKNVNQGKNHLVIDTDSLNNGLYFVRLSMGKNPQIIKVLVNK